MSLWPGFWSPTIMFQKSAPTSLLFSIVRSHTECPETWTGPEFTACWRKRFKGRFSSTELKQLYVQPLVKLNCLMLCVADMKSAPMSNSGNMELMSNVSETSSAFIIRGCYDSNQLLYRTICTEIYWLLNVGNSLHADAIDTQENFIAFSW